MHERRGFCRPPGGIRGGERVAFGGEILRGRLQRENAALKCLGP
jgi:hypothetical protein